MKKIFLLGLLISLLFAGCIGQDNGAEETNQILQQETDQGSGQPTNPEAAQQMPTGQGMPLNRSMVSQGGFEACVGKTIDEACVLESPRGSMNGSCRDMNGNLSCMPEGMGRMPQRMMNGTDPAGPMNRPREKQ